MKKIMMSVFMIFKQNVFSEIQDCVLPKNNFLQSFLFS